MRHCTSYVWINEKFEGELITNLRVRILERNKDDRIQLYSEDLLKHDGKKTSRTGRISEFSYILTSTGVKKMWDIERDDIRYIHICLFITSDFDKKALDSIKCPEMKYVKKALKKYYQEKEIKGLQEFQELLAYMQEERPDKGEKEYNKLVKAIQNADIHQIENLTNGLSWQYKSLVWKKTAQMLATKKQ